MSESGGILVKAVLGISGRFEAGQVIHFDFRVVVAYKSAHKKRRPGFESRASVVRMPAITDFRAKGTIIGPTGLTAVFGMGTGVTPPVWSPTKRTAGVFHPAGRVFRYGL